MKYIVLFILLSVVYYTSKAQSVGGVLNTNTTVCQGSNNGYLSLSGYSGNIQRWEYSYNSSGPWTPIIFTQATYNYVNLLQSTYFRVVVQLTGYPIAISNTVLVNCNSLSIAGTVITNTFQCINTLPSATLVGNTGSVIAWESSINNWISTNTITSTNTIVAQMSPLTTTTQIRAKIQNGVCPIAYTNTMIIVPASLSNGGLIAGTQSVCATSNASTLTLNNFTGTIQQWESSYSSNGPFVAISSTSNTNSISFSNLNQNIWYRVQVQNGNCPIAVSQIFTLNVNAPSVAGNIFGTQVACASNNSGTLQLLANIGQINQWEYSSNNGANWSVINNTSTIQTFTNISNTRLYRANVQNGLCSAVLSSPFTVQINALPTPSFNFANGCQLSVIQFSNISVGANSSVWEFGDLTSSTIYNAPHSFMNSGNYNVKLTATSPQGCIDSLKKTITIYPRPNANFVAVDTVCFGTSVLFTNSSGITSGNITNFDFNFNDGSSIVSSSVAQHSFPNAGTYFVSLKTMSNFGCRDSIIKPITVSPKPISNFSSNNVCKGDASVFQNLSLVTSGALQYNWDFGNGISSNLSSPTYVYPNAGTYLVSLISKSFLNCSDTIVKTIRVHEKTTITFSANNSCFGTVVNFSLTINPIVSASVSVSFGDGNTDNSFNPSHLYSSSGTFASSVSLVTDSGCVSSASKNITIYPKPFANFNFNNVCNSDSAKFINTSSIGGGNLNFIWNFSGLSTTTLVAPNYLFLSPGSYTVSLIAKSNFDCLDTITKPLTIFDAPKSDFIFNNVCHGNPVTFTNTTKVNSGVISNSYWSFGDNTSSSQINPEKEYLNYGNYSVSLISISSNGCKDTTTKTLNVFEGPIAKFSAESKCINAGVEFKNLSLLNSGSVNSFWDFGDGNYSNNYLPIHSYSNAGVYTVWLKLLSSDACVDSISSFVQIFSKPTVYAGRDTTLDKGLGIKLNASGASKYIWTPDIGLANSNTKSPFANPDSSITYIVEGTDINGCINMDTLNIRINDSFLVTPYNILTPDFNGKNDAWLIKNIQAYPENHVIIFDQWNQIVFEEDSYKNTWEGKNKNGELLPDATYYYILSFKDSPKKYSGYITLIRNR